MHTTDYTGQAAAEDQQHQAALQARPGANHDQRVGQGQDRAHVGHGFHRCQTEHTGQAQQQQTKGKTRCVLGEGCQCNAQYKS
ncbi:hypothetical protein D3C81_2155810 [compost metagenome]